MGLFSKKPDPVGDICRLLTEKPFEWTLFSPEPKKTRGALFTSYTHVTGIAVLVPASAGLNGSLMYSDGTGTVGLSRPDDLRVRRAVLSRIAAVAKSRRIDVPETGKLLARAVLDGHADGVWPLVDYLLENVERPKEGG